MRTKEYTVTGFALDRDGLVVSANPIAGTPMTLLAAAASLSPPREVAIYSAADQTAVSFVVVGTDRNGVSITETITGPGAGLTVRGRLVYGSVTSITPSASPGTATEVGWVARTVTPWVICSLWTGKEGTQVGAARVSVIELTGAADGDVEVTYDFPGGYPNGIIKGVTATTPPKVDETVAVTPLTPVTAQGIMCRFVLTTGAGTGATVRFARPG